MAAAWLCATTDSERHALPTRDMGIIPARDVRLGELHPHGPADIPSRAARLCQGCSWPARDISGPGQRAPEHRLL
jgi:hypothetical protein